MLGGGAIIFFGTVHAVAIAWQKRSISEVKTFAIQVRIAFNAKISCETHRFNSC